MNTDVKNTWISRLQSGQFCQAKGHLRIWNPQLDRHEYCCLGLLCEQSGLAEWVEDSVLEDGLVVYSYLGETEWLPAEVAHWARLELSHRANSDQNFFIDANDNEDFSFPKIADLVEIRFCLR